MERLAFQLLEETSSESFELALKTIASLESLIGLGRAIYEVEPVNANIIIGELESLNSAIRQLVGLDDSETEEAPDLGRFFSKVPAVISQKKEYDNGPTIITEENGNGPNVNGNGLASAIRQSAILEKIRQSANRQIQLKEILAAFPEVSERTMRYDLQKLCSQSLIERIGNGGPGSYYVLK